MAKVLIPLCYECAIGDPTTATPAVWITLLRKPADGVWEWTGFRCTAHRDRWEALLWPDEQG